MMMMKKIQFISLMIIMMYDNDDGQDSDGEILYCQCKQTSIVFSD